MTDILRAAIDYAHRGWPVFPIIPGTKKPATARGFHDATTDTATIHKWFSGHPRGLAVATGAAGLVVIDIDPCDGIRINNTGPRPELEIIGTDGWGSWLSLAHRHGGETPTMEVGTPSGGAHLWFLAPEGDPIKCSASRLAPGVDVRGVGGYIIAPPTAGYSLDVDLAPAPLPVWMCRLLRPALPPRPPAPAGPRGRGYAQAALREECEAVRSAAEGTRNHTLNRAAFNIGTLIGGRDLDAHQAAQALYDSAIAAGLPHGEAVTTINSGLRAGHARPRTSA